MTPLFAEVVKSGIAGKTLLMPDGGEVLEHLNGVACVELGGSLMRTGAAETASFLPAPAMWIEYRNKHTEEPVRVGEHAWMRVISRRGLLISDVDFPIIHGFMVHRLEFTGAHREVEIEVKPQNYDLTAYFGGSETERAFAEETFDGDYYPLPSHLIALLALINTPRLVGRKIHDPHRGLVRKMAASSKVPARFEAKPWTEIKLELREPGTSSGDGGTDVVHTAGRALHFCRAHLRVRLGRLEYVRAHRRGSVEAGIKKSRYRVKE